MGFLVVNQMRGEQGRTLISGRRRIATLRTVCEDQEKQKQDELSTASTRVEEAWKKYENRQRDILGLTADTEDEDEQAIFNEMKEIYEAAIDGAKKILKKAAAEKAADDKVLMEGRVEQLVEKLKETKGRLTAREEELEGVIRKLETAKANNDDLETRLTDMSTKQETTKDKEV